METVPIYTGLGRRPIVSSVGLLGVYPVWLHLQNRQPVANGTSSTNTGIAVPAIKYFQQRADSTLTISRGVEPKISAKTRETARLPLRRSK